MITRDMPLSQQLAAALTRREAELRAILDAANRSGDRSFSDVSDFKDAADQESRSAVDEAATASAADELAQVIAAIRRMEEGSYGLCLNCGEPIDERRLLALPATPYCTACQAARERAAAARH